MSPLATFSVILAVYLVLVYAMYRETLPAIWGLMLMSVFTLAIVAIMRGGVTYKDFYTLMAQGSYRIAPAVFSFMFAGVFARAQIDTGIVENVVKRAAELGGDRPLIVTILLGLASAYVTIGAFAGGAFICLVIALPILLSLGLSPITATVIQVFAVGHAGMLWAQHWAYFGSFTKLTLNDMWPFLMVYQPFITATWIGLVIYEFKVNKLPLRWSTPTKDLFKVERKVPLYALLCPLLPLFFILVLKMSDIMAFIVGSVVAVIVTQPGSGRKLSDLPGLFSRIYINGINDMAYLIAILVGIGFITRAADFPFVKEVLGGGLQTILPSSPISFILFFAVFMVFFDLFRGPAQPWAMGAAVFGSIFALGKYPPLVTGALLAAFDSFCLVGDPTSGYVVYGCALTKVSIMDYFKKAYVWASILGVIGIVLLTIYHGMW
jgi:hypothetical protein